MHPFDKALRNIYRIPSEVLNLTFMTKISVIPNITTTLDEQIIRLVIKGIVMKDINLIRGMSFTIDISKCNQWVIDYNPTAKYLMVEVPYELTNNKEILTPLSLTYNPIYNTPTDLTFPSNGLLRSAETALNSIDTNVGGIHTTNLELVGPNTILVHENIYSAVGGYMRVVVENDDELRNLKPQAHIVFAELCEWACKGYIHTKLVVELDKGYIYGGHELNKVMDIVDGYADAWERYDELLKEKWAKVAFMNDSESYSRYISMLVNPAL